MKQFIILILVFLTSAPSLAEKHVRPTSDVRDVELVKVEELDLRGLIHVGD